MIHRTNTWSASRELKKRKHLLKERLDERITVYESNVTILTTGESILKIIFLIFKWLVISIQIRRLEFCPQSKAASKSIIEVTYELTMRISNQTSISRNPWRLFMRSININLVMIMRWRCPRYLNATSYAMRLRINTTVGRGNNETTAWFEIMESWLSIIEFLLNTELFLSFQST